MKKKYFNFIAIFLLLASSLNAQSTDETAIKSSSRSLSASFYANNIHNQYLPDVLFCTTHNITFRAEIEHLGTTVAGIEWYIDGIEESSEHNSVIWDKTFVAGNYSVEMWVYSIDEDTVSVASTLTIGAHILATSNSIIGGSVSGSGCYAVGVTAELIATPEECYRFNNWTANGIPVSNSATYTFIVTQDSNLTANFTPIPPSNIFVFANPGGMATGSALNVPCGETRTAIASPFIDYNFVNWTDSNGNEVSTLNPFTFVVTESKTLYANFTLKSYQITTTPNTPDMGTTSGDGIYLSGELITVTATPYSLYRFVDWTENGNTVSTEAVYSFPVSQNRNLVANFEIKNFTVNVLPYPGNGGTVTGGGNHIPYGQLITVTATPYLEYTFLYWTIDGVVKSVATEYSFNVIQSVTVIAHFKPKTCNIMVWANPPWGGTVTGDTTNIPYGALYTISAYPNPNYHFVNWTENGDHVSSNADYTFIVHRSHNLVANFALNTYDIILTAQPEHGGYVTGGGTNILHGTVINAQATPANSHFFFEYWTENGDIVSTDALYQFTATRSRSLVAHFGLETFTVTVTADPPDGGTVEGGGTDIPYLTVITVIATPDSCHIFECWTENGDTVSLIPQYTFPVTENHHLIAHFTLKTFNIYTSEDSPGNGTTYGGNTNIPCGTEITVTAIPEIGYAFVNWTENGVPVSDTANYTFTVIADRELVANFVFVTYNIYLEADPWYAGDVYGSGTYPLGFDLTVLADAHPEYRFVNWTENGDTISISANYQFIVDRDRYLIAHFEDALFDVTVSASPGVGGIATGDTTGLTYGAWHTVTATPNQYFTFRDWTENGVWVSDSAIYHFPVHHSCHLVANFVPEECIITVTRIPLFGGMVSGGGAFPVGTVDTIKAFPALDHTFDKWTENDSLITNSPSYSFTVMTSRNFVAHFKPKNYIINLTAEPSGGGTVSGGGTYLYNEIAPVRAVADTNYVFDKWTEDGNMVSEMAYYPFPVTRSRNLVAHFRLKTFNIIVTEIIPNGSGTVDGGGYNISWGTDTAVSAFPFMNYNFDRWTENGDTVSVDSVYRIIVKRDHDLVAHFTPKMYHINVTAYPVQWGNVTGSGDYAYLSYATVSAVPLEGYTFKEWTENGEPVSDSATYTFCVNHARNLVANFERATYNIILKAEPEEGGEVHDTEYNVPFGTIKTVIAIPNEQCHFINWTENDIPVSDEAEYQFTVTKSRYLVANFTAVTHAITLISIPPDAGILSGGGNIPHGREHTIKAKANDCYEFVKWVEADTLVCEEPDYQFTVEDDRIFLAYFKKINVNITTEANPPEGGTVEGEYFDVACGTPVIIKADPNPEYTFINWTRDGEEVSLEPEYQFPAVGGNFVANFAINQYTITLIADPSDLGTVSGGGTFDYGEEITVKAKPKTGFSLLAWTEDGIEVSTDVNYTFTVERSRTLVAQFEKLKYTVTVDVNNETYGHANGGGKFDANQIAQVKAFPIDGYQFINWTKDGVIVSTKSVYEFPVVENVTLIANFYAIEFDDYAVTLWDNTFMLNLKKLANEGYEVTGCKWFKNSKEEKDTRTIDAYSYSAGPKKTDLLELEPTYYSFQLITKDGSRLNSTNKILTKRDFEHAPLYNPLFVYPNPVFAGNAFTLEGLTKDTPIEVYNQYGVCVHKAIAKDETATLALNLPVGVYIIRNNNKIVRITIIK
ncbi:MAG: T9SS type A sorting domain-containing protein [Bacteroidetes bacterium]|nr:T9SS type A sorting domain-containing protein [Bacteroidota bacterium]